MGFNDNFQTYPAEYALIIENVCHLSLVFTVYGVSLVIGYTWVMESHIHITVMSGSTQWEPTGHH